MTRKQAILAVVNKEPDRVFHAIEITALILHTRHDPSPLGYEETAAAAECYLMEKAGLLRRVAPARFQAIR